MTNQEIKYSTEIDYYGEKCTLTATVRFDDRCGNGHKTFSITGDIVANWIPGTRYRNSDDRWRAGGCLHDEIAAAFPDLAPLIKWHLTSTDGPMHYVANTLYWLGYDRRWCDDKPTSPPNLAHARSSAVWPDMPEVFLARRGMPIPGLDKRAAVTRKLQERASALQAEFRTAVESLGFAYE